MPASIHALQVSKHGLPLIILKVHLSQIDVDWHEAFVVWPEPPLDNSAGVASIVKLGIRRVFERDEVQEISKVRGIAFDEAIAKCAADEAEKHRHVQDKFSLAEIEPERLRAWRSLGYFPALDRAEILNSHAVLHLLGDLAPPVYFDR